LRLTARLNPGEFAVAYLNRVSQARSCAFPNGTDHGDAEEEFGLASQVIQRLTVVFVNASQLCVAAMS